MQRFIASSPSGDDCDGVGGGGISNGFIYAVSSSTTTGNSKVGEGKGIKEQQETYFKKLKDMKLINPV